MSGLGHTHTLLNVLPGCTVDAEYRIKDEPIIRRRSLHGLPQGTYRV